MQIIQIAFLFCCALLLVVPGMHSVVALFSLVGLLVRKKAAAVSPITNDNMRISWSFLLGAYLLFVLLGLLTNFLHLQDDPGLYERFIPFIVIPALGWVIRAGNWRTQHWLLFIGAGGLLSFAYAMYEFASLGLRAEGATENAIKFGNASVFLATICIFAAAFYPFPARPVLWRIFMALSAAGSLSASMLSGSKGGWPALALVLVIAAILATRKLSSIGRVLISSGVFLISILAFVSAPRSLVYDRVVQSYEAASHWISSDGEVTDGSVSLRFKLWSLGLEIFSEHPLIGAGYEQKNLRWAELVAVDPASEFIGENVSSHNDIIEVLSESGVVGVIGLLAMYIGTLLAFWRWRSHPDPEIFTLAWIGISLVICYVIFGLTVSVTAINFFRIIFVTLCVTLLAFITLRVRSLSDQGKDD